MALDEQLVRYARDLARVYADREETEAAWGEALVRLLEHRFPHLEGHHRRVTYWADHLNRRLGEPLSRRSLLRAARLHDVGLLALPDETVRAWVRSVSEGERPDEPVRQDFLTHAPLGAEVLVALPGFAEGAEWVRHHHEAWDGSGGPAGLAGEAIPLGARVLAVAEVFDYQTHLQKGLSIPAARERLLALAGGRLDPALVTAFLELPLESLHENLLWLEAHEGPGD